MSRVQRALKNHRQLGLLKLPGRAFEKMKMAWPHFRIRIKTSVPIHVEGKKILQEIQAAEESRIQ